MDEIRNSCGAVVVVLLTAGMDCSPKAPPEDSEAGIGAQPEAGPVGPRAPTKAGESLTRALLSELGHQFLELPTEFWHALHKKAYRSLDQISYFGLF